MTQSFNLSETFKFYFNGVAEDGVLDAGSTIGATLYDTTADFAIGATYDTGSTTWFFDGGIDEARVWNLVITADDIQTNYEKQMKTVSPFLFYCIFNDISFRRLFNFESKHI
jgi:hypothetical protein